MKTGLRRLRYFLDLSERLNFRRSAEAMGLSQPALSRAIAQLEAELGFALFARDNRNVALTEAGEVFRRGCFGVLEGLDREILRARRTASGEGGQLIIGYTDIAISGCLAGIVRQFRIAHPDISVLLQPSNSEVQLERLRIGEIDFGFVTGPLLELEFEGIAVQEDPLAAILPPSHPFKDKSEVSLADMAHEPFVLGSEERWRTYHKLLYWLCREVGFEPDVVQRAPDTQGIVGLVACGMGVSVQANRSIHDDRVHVRPIADCPHRVTTFAVWPKKPRRKIVATFVDHVRRL